MQNIVYRQLNGKQRGTPKLSSIERGKNRTKRRKAHGIRNIRDDIKLLQILYAEVVLKIHVIVR